MKKKLFYKIKGLVIPFKLKVLFTNYDLFRISMDFRYKRFTLSFCLFKLNVANCG